MADSLCLSVSSENWEKRQPVPSENHHMGKASLQLSWPACLHLPNETSALDCLKQATVGSLGPPASLSPGKSPEILLYNC